MAFKFEKSFGRRLGMAHTALARHLGSLMKEAKLPITPDQFRVLTHLWTQDGRSQQELANLSGRDRANVTRVIDILEREGIVERRDDPDDRRVFNIFLTRKGRSIEADTARCAQKAISDALKGFTKEEIAMLMDLLGRVRANLN